MRLNLRMAEGMCAFPLTADFDAEGAPRNPASAGPSSATTGPILFYDGTCGFCARSVQFILRRERRRQTLRFATLQGPTAARLLETHPGLARVDSVIWYEAPTEGTQERLLLRSDAGMAAMAYIGGIWRLFAAVLRVVPRFIRDAVYDTIARHRKKIARNDSCLLPTDSQRARFIE